MLPRQRTLQLPWGLADTEQSQRRASQLPGPHETPDGMEERKKENSLKVGRLQCQNSWGKSRQRRSPVAYVLPAQKGLQPIHKRARESQAQSSSVEVTGDNKSWKRQFEQEVIRPQADKSEGKHDARSGNHQRHSDIFQGYGEEGPNQQCQYPLWYIQQVQDQLWKPLPQEMDEATASEQGIDRVEAWQNWILHHERQHQESHPKLVEETTWPGQALLCFLQGQSWQESKVLSIRSDQNIPSRWVSHWAGEQPKRKGSVGPHHPLDIRGNQEKCRDHPEDKPDDRERNRHEWPERQWVLCETINPADSTGHYEQKASDRKGDRPLGDESGNAPQTGGREMSLKHPQICSGNQQKTRHEQGALDRWV
jgi:hypothetical protein